MVDHPTIVMNPEQTPAGAIYKFGLLGILNGLLYDETPGDMSLIEACYTEGASPELFAFRLRTEENVEQVPDMRVLPVAEVRQGDVYRVTDRSGKTWKGICVGMRSNQGEGIHLRLADDAVVLIYFHDVAKVIRVNS